MGEHHQASSVSCYNVDALLDGHKQHHQHSLCVAKQVIVKQHGAATLVNISGSSAASLACLHTCTHKQKNTSTMNRR